MVGNIDPPNSENHNHMQIITSFAHFVQTIISLIIKFYQFQIWKKDLNSSSILVKNDTISDVICIIYC